MSMISEQIERLRHIADCGFSARGYARELYDVARTIEELSTKLASANMERSTAYYNGGWIPVSERLPREGNDELYPINLVTLDNGDVCLGVYRNKDEEWLTRMSEGEHWYTNKHTVLAWQPRPEPYKEE